MKFIPNQKYILKVTTVYYNHVKRTSRKEKETLIVSIYAVYKEHIVFKSKDRTWDYTEDELKDRIWYWI